MDRDCISARTLRGKKNVKEMLKMPAGVTTNVQLDQLARLMRVPFFRDVFMRNALPISSVRRNKSGIVNLDGSRYSLGSIRKEGKPSDIFRQFR